MRINALKQQLNEAKTAYEALLDEQVKAADGKRAFTEEEKAVRVSAKSRITALEESIATEDERLASERGRVASGAASRIEVRAQADDDPRRGFRSHRDFLTAVMESENATERSAIRDERLKPLAVFDREDRQAGGKSAFLLPRAFTPRGVLATAGSDEQGEYNLGYGGAAVPTSRYPGILSIGFEGDPTAGRTMNLPMGTPSVEIMARVDKDHSTSVSGGFTVTRKPETVSATSSRVQLEMITMKAASLFGLTFATEELLQDSPQSFIAIADEGFRTQFGAAILNEKINGKGGSEYLGILTALATSSGNTGPTISIAKESGQAAGTFVYANILKMVARAWGLGNAIFLANHTCRPQLAQLVMPAGVGGFPVYQPSPNVGLPDRLLGVPIFYTEYCKTVGTVGDLILANMSQFLEGTYSPIQSAESVHVRFTQHERAFKFWTRNAGAPWWKSPLTPANGDTLSPFVVLATRS